VLQSDISRCNLFKNRVTRALPVPESIPCNIPGFDQFRNSGRVTQNILRCGDKSRRFRNVNNASVTRERTKEERFHTGVVQQRYIEADNRIKVSVDGALHSVMVVRDFGTVEEWSAKCAAQ
jgi:hypothetical protein